MPSQKPECSRYTRHDPKDQYCRLNGGVNITLTPEDKKILKENPVYRKYATKNWKDLATGDILANLDGLERCDVEQLPLIKYLTTLLNAKSQEVGVRTDLDCHLDGTRRTGELTDDHRWHSKELVVTCAAGAKANQVLVDKDAFDASLKAEMLLYDIVASQLTDNDVTIINLISTFSGSGGSLEGQWYPATLNYLASDSSGRFTASKTELHYIAGKRMRSDTANSDILVSVTGGLDVEQIAYTYLWRAY